jgi:hypothetical protein
VSDAPAKEDIQDDAQIDSQRRLASQLVSPTCFHVDLRAVRGCHAYRVITQNHDCSWAPG